MIKQAYNQGVVAALGRFKVAGAEPGAISGPVLAALTGGIPLAGGVISGAQGEGSPLERLVRGTTTAAGSAAGGLAGMHLGVHAGSRLGHTLSRGGNMPGSLAGAVLGGLGGLGLGQIGGAVATHKVQQSWAGKDKPGPTSPGEKKEAPKSEKKPDDKKPTDKKND